MRGTAEIERNQDRSARIFLEDYHLLQANASDGFLLVRRIAGEPVLRILSSASVLSSRKTLTLS